MNNFLESEGGIDCLETGKSCTMSDRESGDEQQQTHAAEKTDCGEKSAHSEDDETVETGHGKSSSGRPDRHSEASEGGPNAEQELATRVLHIQSKRFYLDVKQNRRGRFIKVAEVGSGGKKSRLLLAMSSAAEFRDYLSDFSDHYASLGPTNSETPPEDGKLKSEMIVKDNRRYYLDLKENQRGRFLRVSEQVSQTMPRGGPRSQIAIPAQGMIEFRDALTELLEEFGTDDQEPQNELPESRSMRIENKMFYFDVGSNRRGVYLRVSEVSVRNNFRTAITIPERSWGRFRDIISEFVDKPGSGPKAPAVNESE